MTGARPRSRGRWWLALLATACDEAECEARKPGPWTCLPATDHGFSSCSSLAQGLGGNAVRALNELVNKGGRGGQLHWLQGDGLPALPWRSDWPAPEQQQLVNDYMAYVSPYLLTLPRLDDGLREQLEQLAVQQLDLIEFVFPLLPVVLDLQINLELCEEFAVAHELASLLPALRIGRLDPSTVLRGS